MKKIDTVAICGRKLLFLKKTFRHYEILKLERNSRPLSSELKLRAVTRMSWLLLKLH